MKRLKLKFSFRFRLQSLKEEVGVYTFAGLKEVLNFPRHNQLTMKKKDFWGYAKN